MGVWFGVWSGPLRVNALFCVHSNQVLFLEKPDEPLYQEGAVLANRRMRLEGKVNKQENADRLAQCILVAFFLYSLINALELNHHKYSIKYIFLC